MNHAGRPELLDGGGAGLDRLEEHVGPVGRGQGTCMLAPTYPPELDRGLIPLGLPGAGSGDSECDGGGVGGLVGGPWPGVLCCLLT